MLLPVALIAGGHWKCIATGMLTVALMTAATLLAFGSETWTAFLGSLPFSREAVIEHGATGFEKFQTVFGAIRLLGGSVLAAYAAQGAASLASAAVVAALWRSRADRRLASAALLCGCLLATPYALDYDMMVLGPAIAFLASYELGGGFGPYEQLMLTVTWCVPLIARLVAGATSIPIGIICVALCLLGWRDARGAARRQKGQRCPWSSLRSDSGAAPGPSHGWLARRRTLDVGAPIRPNQRSRRNLSGSCRSATRANSSIGY